MLSHRHSHLANIKKNMLCLELLLKQRKTNKRCSPMADQLFADTGCRLEDLQWTMADRS